MGNLEVGRMYVTMGGRDVGPMEDRPSLSYPFMVGGGVLTYTQGGQHSTVVGDNLNIDFHASEKKFPKEKAMEDISKKFHDNMHVKLRNGVEIIGLRLVDGKPRLTGVTLWWENGRRDLKMESQADIVEVLSKPPATLCTSTVPTVGMLITSPGFLVPWEVKAVETVRVAEPNRVRDKFYVLLTKIGNNPSLRVWEDLTDWVVSEGNNGKA